MKEGNKYTLIMVALLFLIVFGGWFLMDKMLSAKEKQILSQTGQVAIPSVINDDKKESADGTGLENSQGEFMGKVLSEEEIAGVLSAWEAGGRKIPHDPLTGQMSMAQAVDKGSRWIAALAEKEMLPDEMLTENFDNITAKLFTLENETDIEMQMLSMWEITYTKNDVKIDMKIHAWSGEVWGADITMDKELAVYKEVEGEKLLDTAFSAFAWRGRSHSVYLDNGIYYEKGRNGSVYIALQKYEVTSTQNGPVSGIYLWLGTELESKN